MQDIAGVILQAILLNPNENKPCILVNYNCSFLKYITVL